ncbi:hypothetical protein BOTCAL_0112g00160 [Botryotinia calthae]|uniref:Uncharacterized protein n=1 Tax=Botryotinia calthae TaxID=38488 RepID=A0A4Y8D7J5_9HELO|nr:hypothetical protein BOTCAL_0112g00160 [Botryotinia calthae]
MSAPTSKTGLLNNSIQTTPRDSLSIQAKCAIVSQLFRGVGVSTAIGRSDVPDYELYFTYYTEQCNQALHDGGRHISARTHRDIVETSEHFKSGASRGDIIQILMAKLPTHRQTTDGEKLVNGTIDLAARLVLMMDFGEFMSTTASLDLWFSVGLSSPIVSAATGAR